MLYVVETSNTQNLRVLFVQGRGCKRMVIFNNLRFQSVKSYRVLARLGALLFSSSDTVET